MFFEGKLSGGSQRLFWGTRCFLRQTHVFGSVCLVLRLSFPLWCDSFDNESAKGTWLVYIHHRTTIYLWRVPFVPACRFCFVFDVITSFSHVMLVISRNEEPGNMKHMN